MGNAEEAEEAERLDRGVGTKALLADALPTKAVTKGAMGSTLGALPLALEERPVAEQLELKGFMQASGDAEGVSSVGVVFSGTVKQGLSISDWRGVRLEAEAVESALDATDSMLAWRTCESAGDDWLGVSWPRPTPSEAGAASVGAKGW